MTVLAQISAIGSDLLNALRRTRKPQDKDKSDGDGKGNGKGKREGKYDDEL